MKISRIELKNAFEKVKNFTSKSKEVLEYVVILGYGDMAKMIATNTEVSIEVLMNLELPSTETFVLKPFHVPEGKEIILDGEDSENIIVDVDGVTYLSLKPLEIQYPLAQVTAAFKPYGDMPRIHIAPKYLMEVAKACKKDGYITLIFDKDNRPLMYKSRRGTQGVICPIKVNK